MKWKWAHCFGQGAIEMLGIVIIIIWYHLCLVYTAKQSDPYTVHFTKQILYPSSTFSAVQWKFCLLKDHPDERPLLI